MSRYFALDFFRGVAVILMIIFHICFDMTMFGHLKIDFYDDPFWFAFPRLIVFIFLLCVGASLGLAHQKTIHWTKVGKRFFKLLALAVIISVTTYFLFPHNWVYFGTLHCIAFTSLAATPFTKRPRLSLLLSVIILVSQFFLPSILIPLSEWLKVKSMDYIPFYPWIGVVLLGIFAESKGFASMPIPQHPLSQFTAYLGRHSLLIYLLHQPLIYGILYAWKMLS